MGFTGWTDEAIGFFEHLEAENTKTFWLANKHVYDTEVLAPMQALLADLAGEFGQAKLFRPYRDVRFSADKSPYKTTIAAEIERAGYLQFSADGLAAGAGGYQLAADQLERYRQAVADDETGPELERIVAKLATNGSQVTAREQLKTAPRGYAKDHPRIDLLRHKGIIAWREFPPADWLGSPKAPKALATFFRSTAPLKAWLATNVGDSRVG
jgi:uncharacterized protein (TIGR02453 family)